MSSFEAARPKRPMVHQLVENTVRLRGDELDRIHEDLDAQSPGAGSIRRKYVRWPFRCACIRVDIISGSRTASTLKYACRNLSGSGVSILHSAYMHPGTDCIVYLPSLAGKLVRLTGRVKRCRHFSGHIHEIGIQFCDPFEVGQFVDLDPYNERFAYERADPKRLGGSILHVESSEEDRRLLRHILRDTECSVAAVATAAAALPRIKEGFDAVVVDSTVGDVKGTELAQQMRAAGCRAPIIITSSDGSPAMREAARLSQVGAFLVKPLLEATVLRALADILPARGPVVANNTPIPCTLKPDDPARKDVPKVIAELQTASRDIQIALEAGDIAALRRHCVRVKTAAVSTGFDPVASFASEANRVLKSGDLEEASGQLRALIDACRRVSIEFEPGSQPAGKVGGVPPSHHAKAA